MSTEFPPGPGGIGNHGWNLSRKINDYLRPQDDFMNHIFTTLYRSVKDKPYDLSIIDFLCLKTNIKLNNYKLNSFLTYIKELFLIIKKLIVLFVVV